MNNNPGNFFKILKTILLVLVINLSGCAAYQYEAEAIDTEQIVSVFNARDISGNDLKKYFEYYGYPVNDWPLKTWDLHALTLAGYYFNSGLQVAIAEYNKTIINMDNALLYPNPGIQIPLEHHEETSGGISPWLIGIVIDLVFERQGKRQARLDHARSESESARLAIQLRAWQIYVSVRQSYLDYFVALSTKEYLERKLEVVKDILTQLMHGFELGQTSEFELNTMRLELQKARLELASQEVAITDASHHLANAAGLPVEIITDLNISFDEIPQYLDVSSLIGDRAQEIALTHRLDMQHALSDYAIYESALKLEIENQYPDINLGPGFIFDQGDNIWSLGASWIIPLLHPHNEGPVKLALEDRKIKQAEIISIQTGIINDTALARARLASTGKALKQAEILLQEGLERNRQMQKQFDLGYLDNLSMMRNKLELLSIEGALADFELHVINAVFNYEDAVQYPLLDISGYQMNEPELTTRPQQ